VLSSTFDWPNIPREPTDVVLPAFVAGGTSLVWTWFATAWAYAVLLVRSCCSRPCSGPDDPVLRAATFLGATSVVTLGGIDVEEQFTIHGAYGAITFSPLSGLLLLRLLPGRPAVSPDHTATPVPVTA
jgi:hypothetical protein